MTLQLVGTHLAGSESQHLFMMQWLQCALLLHDLKPIAASPNFGDQIPCNLERSQEFCYRFSLLSFLHFAGILEQSIHHCHSEEENKRLADSPSSVLSKGVTNTTRRCSFTKSIIPSESNATGENPTHHKETPSKADHHFWGTKRATPKQRESHCL